jgi:hypothetical protein
MVKVILKLPNYLTKLLRDQTAKKNSIQGSEYGSLSPKATTMQPAII